MARSVKIEDHTVKRNEILDVAQRLITTKGYEQMSIQDIIGTLKISKGAFYHYFDSKSALLEALMLRLEEEAERLIIPIIEDTQLDGLQKLQRMFAATGAWKTDRKEYMLGILQGWYADHNAIVREKLTHMMTRRISVFLGKIIQQGVAEGKFNVPHPEHSASVVMTLLIGLGNATAYLFLDFFYAQDLDQKLKSLAQAESTVHSYTTAMEQILGAPAGSVELMNFQQIRAWAEAITPAIMSKEDARVTTNNTH